MLPPLRYITSMQEWGSHQPRHEQAYGGREVWLDAAGDRERARDAIRAYYGRVESANRNFTSHVEGWRTDCGPGAHHLRPPKHGAAHGERGSVDLWVKRTT